MSVVSTTRSIASGRVACWSLVLLLKWLDSDVSVIVGLTVGPLPPSCKQSGLMIGVTRNASPQVSGLSPWYGRWCILASKHVATCQLLYNGAPHWQHAPTHMHTPCARQTTLYIFWHNFVFDRRSLKIHLGDTKHVRYMSGMIFDRSTWRAPAF